MTCSAVSNSLQPHGSDGLWPAGLLCPWAFLDLADVCPPKPTLPPPPHLVCQRFCKTKEGRRLSARSLGWGSMDHHNSSGCASTWPWEILSLDSDRYKEENTTVTQPTQYNLNLDHVHLFFSKNTIRKACESCVTTTTLTSFLTFCLHGSLYRASV